MTTTFNTDPDLSLYNYVMKRFVPVTREDIKTMTLDDVAVFIPQTAPHQNLLTVLFHHYKKTPSECLALVTLASVGGYDAIKDSLDRPDPTINDLTQIVAG